MADGIHRGSHGRTEGPLKPSGRIRINSETFDACSEGSWIDADAMVVVVGNRANNLIVRSLRPDDPPTETLGEILPIGDVPETTPLHAPPTMVERINAIAVGGVVGCVLIPIVWIRGTPLSLSALFVPVAGAAAGFLFQWFVRGALPSVGPRQDHRPHAITAAILVTFGAAVGAIVGVAIGLGFLGLGGGLVLGALVGGLVKWIEMLLSMV